MKTFMRLGFLSMAIILQLGMASSQSASAGSAPDFTLKDTNGTSHSLSDFRGKYVVLEWINHDCPFIKKHYKSGNMQQLQKTYKGKGVVWLSINSSAPGKQGNYSSAEWNKLSAKKGAQPTAVLLDPSGKVGRLYGAKTTPHMFIINPEGQLIYNGAIDDIRSADPADVPRANNYVKQVLDEVMGGQSASVSSTQPYGCSVKY